MALILIHLDGCHKWQFKLASLLTFLTKVNSLWPPNYSYILMGSSLLMDNNNQRSQTEKTKLLFTLSEMRSLGQA